MQCFYGSREILGRNEAVTTTFVVATYLQPQGPAYVPVIQNIRTPDVAHHRLNRLVAGLLHDVCHRGLYTAVLGYQVA